MLYILTPVFCVALSCGAVFSFSLNNNKIKANAAAANGSASVLSVDTKTGTANGNFENKIQGEQTEYVYFGNDPTVNSVAVNSSVSYTSSITKTTTPMKWRVLTKNDTKYGRGSNLLLQTENFYPISYNDAPSTDTVLWGMSNARAVLNGTKTTNGDSIEIFYGYGSTGYLKQWTTLSMVDAVAIGDNTNFLHAIQGTNPYITRVLLWADNQAYVKATDFVTTYPFYNDNAKKTLNTGNDVTGGNQYVVGDKVSGDRMFYLDIEDCANTASYGFYDTNVYNSTNQKKTYFDLIGERTTYSYTGWQNGYPSFVASNGLQTDAMRIAAGKYVTMREAFVNATNSSSALITLYGSYTGVNSGITYNCGNMVGGYSQNYAGNGRPATVLDLSQVVYANGSVGNVGSTLTGVTGSSTAKPEYKLYIKDSAFSTYNAGFEPVITSANNKVKVTFKNNSGKAGNAVLLLQDKNATDGSVAYQAVTAMNSGTAEQSVEFNIPSGLVYKNYIPTVMLTSANTTSATAMATEAVYATYTQDGIIVPKDIGGADTGVMEYSAGTNHWLDGLNFKTVNGETPKDPVWIDKSTHLDSSVINVKKISYKSHLKDAAEQDKTSDGTSKIINAGVYTITLEIVDKTNFHWLDGTTEDKSFKITVGQIDIDSSLTVTVDYKDEEGNTKEFFAGWGTDKFPGLKVCDAWKNKGTIKWDDDQSLSNDKDKEYKWTFTPSGDDAVNYKEKKGTSKITVTQVGIKSIKAERKDTDPVYTSTTPEKLLERLKVTATNNDGSDGGTLDATDLKIKDVTELSAGKNVKLTVQLKVDSNVTCDITIDEILAVKPVSLVVTHDGTTVTTVTDLDVLKGQLTVKIKNNDGTTGNTLNASDFKFEDGFKLTDGDEVPVKVIYEFGDSDPKEKIEGQVKIKVGSASVTKVTIKKVEVPDGTTLWEGAAASTIKGYLTVEVEYENDSSTATTLKATDNFTVNIVGGGNKLTAGTCMFTVTYGGKTSNTKSVTVTAIVVTEITIQWVQSGSIYSTAAASDITKAGTLVVTATYNNGDEDDLPDTDYSLTLQKDFSSINNTVTVTWLKDGKPTDKTQTFTVTVTDRDVSGINVTYTLPDGFKLDASKGLDDLKAGIVAKLTFNDGGEEQELKPEQYTLSAADSDLFGEGENKKLKAGTRTITIKYSDGITNTFTVTVEKATVDTTEITFKPADDTADGLEPDGNGGYKGTYKPDGEFGIGIDPDSLPTGVTVKTGYPKYQVWKGDGAPTFDGNGKPTGSGWQYLPAGEKPTGAGTYVAEVDFDYDDKNFETIDPVSTVVTVGKGTHDTSGSEVKPSGGASTGLKPSDNGGYVGTYTEGGDYGIDIDPATLPDGVSAGTPVYKKLKEDGNPDNPDDWTVVTKPDGAGTYKVVVELTSDDPDNYNEIDPIEVVLTLSDKAATALKATLEEGAAFTAANTLDELKAKLSAEVEYNNGEKENVAVDNLTVTCEGLRDGGKFKAGLQSVTVKFTDEGGNEVTAVVNITVNKEKVALPEFKGGLSYTGAKILLGTDNFNGFDGALMTFVESKLPQETIKAGSYKAVFALNDPENYEWATTATVSKKLFAAVVYEEVTLDANEAAVDWNIAKAVLTAAATDGALPEFDTGSFVGAITDVVALKYYEDEACTKEIAADKLARSTQYFVKAELLDTENFELDSSAAAFTMKPFSYTTPEGELTVWEKIVNFLKANWLWIVIAVAALILLITIIAVAAKSAKKRRILAEKKEEERLAREERKEEERRQREEERERREEERRREEREERMMRMNQQQAMPQMMPSMMPQMMSMQQPQYAPQPQPQPQPQYTPQVQPVVGGGSSNEIAELKAEISALRAEQNAAKEVAALRVEVMRAEQNAVLRSDVNALRGGEQTVQSGISVDAMTEIMTAALKNVFTSATQQAIAAQPAQPAQLTDGTNANAAQSAPVAAQVPPDAVMTTVTTTKIDTTKKAQSAQGNAQPTRQTRSFVPPMPVDDGRVFDVGGFYKPADPMDFEDSEEDKK